MNLAVWLQLLLCKTVRPVWQNAQWTPQSKNVTWEKGGHPHYPSFSTFEAEYGMWKYTYFLPILNYQKIQSQSPREYWFINNDPGVNPHIGMYKKQINTYIHLRCINPIYIYISIPSGSIMFHSRLTQSLWTLVSQWIWCAAVVPPLGRPLMIWWALIDFCDLQSIYVYIFFYMCTLQKKYLMYIYIYVILVQHGPRQRHKHRHRCVCVCVCIWLLCLLLKYRGELTSTSTRSILVPWSSGGDWIKPWFHVVACVIFCFCFHICPFVCVFISLTVSCLFRVFFSA